MKNLGRATFRHLIIKKEEENYKPKFISNKQVSEKFVLIECTFYLSPNEKQIKYVQFYWKINKFLGMLFHHFGEYLATKA